MLCTFGSPSAALLQAARVHLWVVRYQRAPLPMRVDTRTHMITHAHCLPVPVFDDKRPVYLLELTGAHTHTHARAVPLFLKRTGAFIYLYFFWMGVEKNRQGDSGSVHHVYRTGASVNRDAGIGCNACRD